MFQIKGWMRDTSGFRGPAWRLSPTWEPSSSWNGSVHHQVAAHDPILVVFAAAYAEPFVAGEQAEVDLVRCATEVRFELEAVHVGDEVARLPKPEWVFPLQRVMVTVVASAVAIDVNEGLPISTDGCDDLPVNPEIIRLTRAHLGHR